jgi:ABC-type uncharacterized transport system permease subunit
MDSMIAALVVASLACLAAGLVLSLRSMRREDQTGSRAAYRLHAAGLAFLVIQFVLQSVVDRQLPLSTLRDSFLVFALVLLVTSNVAAQLRSSDLVPVIIAPLVILLEAASLFANYLLQTEQARRMVSETFLATHVVLFMLSYACFVVAAAFGIMFLILDHTLKAKTYQPVFFRLPALTRLDSYASRSMLTGLLLLTVAIGLSFTSLHRLRSAGMRLPTSRAAMGDLTILTPVVLWLYYAVYMLLRVRLGWIGKRTGYVSICGIVLLLVFYVLAKAYPPGILHGLGESIRGAVAP